MNYFDRFCVVGVLRSLLLGHLGNGGENSATYIIFFVTSVIAIAAASYFLGGINFAIIISKKKFGKDIRDFGSGNPGMTNMMRTFGKKVGLLTFAGRGQIGRILHHRVYLSRAARRLHRRSVLYGGAYVPRQV